jgi:hypothetical protein
MVVVDVALLNRRRPRKSRIFIVFVSVGLS